MELIRAEFRFWIEVGFLDFLVSVVLLGAGIPLIAYLWVTFT